MTRQHRKPQSRAGLLACVTSACLLAAPVVAWAELSISRGSVTGTQPTGTAANSNAELHYTLGADESLGSVARQLLSDRYNLQNLQQHNNLSNPHQARPGETLRIPTAWLKRSSQPAEVTALDGTVQRRTANGALQTLQQGMRVRVGEEIITHGGAVTLQLADGAVVRLGSGTRLMLTELTQYGQPGMADTRLRLAQGFLSSDVPPRDRKLGRFEVQTPHATATVKGTTFELSATPAVTSLQVIEGSVAVTSARLNRTIPAGFGADIGTGTGAGMQLRRLLPAPEVTPIAARANRLPVALSWEPTPAAREYRVDVFDGDSGAWLRQHRTQQAQFTLDQLHNGRYDIQVAALDRQGNRGIPWRQPMTVELQARPADLLEPQEGERIKDGQPGFRWRHRGDSEVSRVEIAAREDFEDMLSASRWTPEPLAQPGRPLNPGKYYWRVVTEAGGTSVATSETRSFIVDGTLPPVRILSVNYIDRQVRLFWERIDTVSEYVIQLAEDPGFERIVKEANVADTTAALRLIPGRRYFVRLKAVSDGPLASRWGPGRELFID